MKTSLPVRGRAHVIVPQRRRLSPLAMMRACFDDGQGNITLGRRPLPNILLPTDVIVAMEYSAICDIDLHRHAKHELSPGFPYILGHEGVGKVVARGEQVIRWRLGDRVVISSISACGDCEYCVTGLRAHCARGGWVLGNTIDGTHAEYVRIPYADTSLVAADPAVDPAVQTLASELLPTVHECANFADPGSDAQARLIVGADLCAMVAAAFAAEQLGARPLVVIDEDAKKIHNLVRKVPGVQAFCTRDPFVRRRVRGAFGGRRSPAVIYARPDADLWRYTEDCVDDQGRVATVALHDRREPLRLERLWARNVSVSMGLANGTSTETMLKALASPTTRLGELLDAPVGYEQESAIAQLFRHGPQNSGHKAVLRWT